MDSQTKLNNNNNNIIESNSTLLEDAELAVENLAHQELQLVKEAEDLFKRQVDHIKHIDQLQSFIPNMEKIDFDTKRLSSLVDSSSMLVEDVCGKVRQIDLAKARLDDCLKKIGDILDLKTCRDGMFKAMELENYEEAAMHIKRFLSIDQDELHKTISIICGQQQKEGFKHSVINHLLRDEYKIDDIKRSDENNTVSDKINNIIIDPKLMNSALRELDEARGKLLVLCQENMARAIQEDNSREIERFFKIFPMLNEHQDGLNRYAKYLQNKIINAQVDETLKSKQINQSDKLVVLYENIAKLVDSHQPLIETFYGPGYLIVVVRVIQEECDHLSRKILEEFRNETKLQYVAKVVKSTSLQNNPIQISNTPSPTSNVSTLKLDPRDVDIILNQISLIISRSEVYLNFIVQRVKEDINSKIEDEDQRQSNLLELYSLVCEKCELNHLIQEVECIYIMLEQFYLNESSKKAILMDQIDVESSSYFVSSMLDDIFFIIKKCTKRAVSTKSNEVFCAIINHCVTLLESTFCQVLDERLKNQQYYSSSSFTTKNLDLSQAYSAIQSGRYLQSASGYELAKAQYFSALNNLDKACDYIQTLRGMLDGDIKKLKPSLLVIEQQKDNQMEKSIACLNELSQLVGRFSSIANSSLYQLFNSSLRSRVRSEFKTIVSENPDLTSIVTSNPHELPSLAKSLLAALDRSLQDSLTTENYSKLITITKDFLASSLITIK